MNVTIIGAAKSGLASARLARSLGEKVYVSDARPSELLGKVPEQLRDAGIECEFGGHTDRALSHCDMIVTSPGVPPSNALIKEAERIGIPVISELEYASSMLHNPIIAITGTNGKTTTTALTTFLLNEGGRKAVSAGNIGTPLSDLVGKLDDDTIIVCEASSYQLDRTLHFRPKVAVILNITPDHLSYHGTFEAYQKAKWKLCVNQQEDDLLCLNADDPLLVNPPVEPRCRVARFGMSYTDFGIYRRDGGLFLRFPRNDIEEFLMPIEDLRLPGEHNQYNSMAAILAARAFEIRNENIRDSLMRFDGVEHRLEFVRRIDGIDFINDSKATNINATWYALNSYSRPLVWIAGGRSDDNDYVPLDPSVEEFVHTIVVIGEEANHIFDHYCLTKRCIKAETLDSAVRIAFQSSRAGDVVLFSPACKSFDMFANFEHRGEVFKQSVNELLLS